MSHQLNQSQPTLYQIRIQGHLAERWSDWLGDLVIGIEPQDPTANQTIITVAVPDQAGLRGIVNRLWDLNLTLISIRPAQIGTLGGKDEY